MPIFEYRCQVCGHCFERLVFSSDERTDWPKCGGAEVRELMSCINTLDGAKSSLCASGSPCGFS